MRETGLPLHDSLTSAVDIPHTISYYIRKCAQIISFNDLPSEKRPPEYMWDSPSMTNEWFDVVFNRKKTDDRPDGISVIISDEEFEG